MAIGELTQSTQMPRKNQGDSTGGLTIIRFVNTVVISETASQYTNNQSVKMQQMDTPTHCTPDIHAAAQTDFTMTKQEKYSGKNVFRKEGKWR